MKIDVVIEEGMDRLAKNCGAAYAGDLPGEAQTTLADISAARALGWNPRADIDDGLRGSIDFIKRHVLEPVGQ